MYRSVTCFDAIAIKGEASGCIHPGNSCGFMHGAA